eukprot:scaffold5363_cov400-Prasinococcus_capsulatus_cf.AAC.5
MDGWVDGLACLILGAILRVAAVGPTKGPGGAGREGTPGDRAGPRRWLGTEEAMEDEARARRQRMRALREAAEAKGEVEPEKTEIKFRNYTPKDEELKESKLEPAKPEKLDDVDIDIAQGDEENVQQPGSVPLCAAIACAERARGPGRRSC